MKKAFIYTLNPTDYFVGFMTEREALDAEKGDIEDGEEILKQKIEIAKKLFREHTCWEGDGEVYISGLPGRNSNNYPEIFVIIKQRNNGSTFLCSPVELPYLEEFLDKQVDF
ncbi:hypothetical protein SOV_51050 [Sporomusa ovata DSM 2662]|uniref:Uncharacterized protein n=1 Tax=Sporomusa ovata TaxID=2378 RepID=A0A0U1L0Y0_9FIRM|nr:hypothetical protein [Sporomusa ovata]EQB27478.1 hypothetical protein SOV_2c03740 [Sporomusa ovata DSM 2662]CQR73322.1 hypothetical protein SpAn4DRAFT_2554 [Sporomusa ovata]